MISSDQPGCRTVGLQEYIKTVEKYPFFGLSNMYAKSLKSKRMSEYPGSASPERVSVLAKAIPILPTIHDIP